MGVNGKCSQLIKNWYKGTKSQVKLEGGMLPILYTVERGVKQGSVLSTAPACHGPPTDSASEISVGLSINNIYVGGFLLADAIRSLPTSLKLQESVSQQFCEGKLSQAHNVKISSLVTLALRGCLSVCGGWLYSTCEKSSKVAEVLVGERFAS